MYKLTRALSVALAGSFLVAACAPSVDSTPPGVDAFAASGGARPATGGSGSGGRAGAGDSGGSGSLASGGASATGGVTASTGGGSAPRTGGASASGGRAATGGAPASGGASATGGVNGAGGAAGNSGGGTQPFKGVANPACGDIGRLGSSWWYNWGLSPGACATPEFVPMVAGKNEKTAAAVTTALGRVAAAGYKTVLGFNEPNKVDQSNLTVTQVLDLWPALTANPAIRVGSPATSADAMTWFTDFMTQATTRGLRVDFIALHWYGWNAGSCDARALTLENYIKWAEAIPGNRPIWITEWGCMNQSNPDPATVQTFYSGALAMFARHPRIERYAWYPYIANNELVLAGALTPLGTTLANAPARQ